MHLPYRPAPSVTPHNHAEKSASSPAQLSASHHTFAEISARCLLYIYALLIPLEHALSLDLFVGSRTGTAITKIYGVLIALLITVLRPTFFLAWSWHYVALGLWLLWGIVACYINTTSLFNSVVLNVGFVLILPACITSRRHLEYLWLCLTIGASIAALVTILNPSYTHGEHRLIGMGDLNANTFSILCDLGLICSLFLLSNLTALPLTHYLRTYLWLTVPIFLWCIVAAGSRTALICLGVALTLSAWLFNIPSPRRWFYRGLTALATAAAFVLVLHNSIVTQRFTQSIEAGHTSSREQIWRAAWQLFNEHASPLTGLGLRQADRLLTRFTGSRWFGWDRLDLHSTYLTVLVETGYVGLTLFLIAVFLPFLLLIKQHRTSPLALIAAALFTVMLASGLTTTWYISKVFWLAWFSVVASLRLLDRQVTVSRPRMDGRTQVIFRART
jgi:O-antigen ligase